MAVRVFRVVFFLGVIFLLLPGRGEAQVINEFFSRPQGPGFVEIRGGSPDDAGKLCVLVVSGNERSVGVIFQALKLKDAGEVGFRTSESFHPPAGSSWTLLLVETPQCTSLGATDLDRDDDGVFDQPLRWENLLDSVSVSAGGPGETLFGRTILDPKVFRSSGHWLGAARFDAPDHTATHGSWRRDTVATPGRKNLSRDDYYAGVDTSSPENLRASLHNLIKGHQVYPYSSGSTDTWDILKLADEDPTDSTKILDIYKNHSYIKGEEQDNGSCSTCYNREHSWPNTYGFSNSGDTPYTDCHHLFLSDKGYNSDRGSLPYGDCSSGCSEDPTEVNNGTGGAGMSNWYDGNVWETWPGRRGDVARAQFYMDVRYEGDVPGEPDLVLTDNPALIQSTSGSPAYMGLKSTLLQWSEDDPVDDLERQHNDVVYSYQGNRNPFVDHPEWIACVFEGVCSLFTDGFESGDFSGWSTVVGN